MMGEMRAGQAAAGALVRRQFASHDAHVEVWPILAQAAEGGRAAQRRKHCLTGCPPDYL
jgi:hypothetical protein